ncbi:MAG: hypothetical protein CME31_20015 [Gimesia sp.]|nr:hypothetical protein [Gimesia sp.]
MLLVQAVCKAGYNGIHQAVEIEIGLKIERDYGLSVMRSGRSDIGSTKQYLISAGAMADQLKITDDLPILMIDQIL